MLTQEQGNALFHTGYEWWMFRATYSALSQLPLSDDPVRNALLESLLVHARGLLSFFYGPRWSNDWNLITFGLKLESIPAWAEAWREAVNKRAAHITSVRAGPLSEWSIADIQLLLKLRIEKLREILGDDWPTAWVGDSEVRTTLLIPQGPTGATPRLTDAIGATGARG